MLLSKFLEVFYFVNICCKDKKRITNKWPNPAKRTGLSQISYQKIAITYTTAT